MAGKLDMGLLAQRNPPNLPLPPAEYSQSYMNLLTNAIRLFFNNINSVQHISIARLSIDLSTLPTEAALAELRAGDVYRNTADNTLRIKV
jgi:hypothetical protein